MKRLAVCIVIIGAIIAAGIFSISLVSSKNERLYGLIQDVLEVYGSGSDALPEIRRLADFVQNDYAPTLACVADDGIIWEIEEACARLQPMYESGCDEFAAECETLRAGARKLLLSELPAGYRLL